MSFRQLPDNANLENLKKQAKSLLKLIKQADPSSLSRIKPFFDDPDGISLQDAQLVIARDYGFSSWRKLKQHLESDTPSGQRSPDQIANEFLQHVVLIYSETERADPARFEYAANVLNDHPGILDESIYVACAAGDVNRVKRVLANDGSLVNQKGGYHHWEPLMYAAYSRLTGADTLSVARVLLDAGANPNANYMWGGQYRFTALTGVFGQGEGGPVRLPEHPRCETFARLLLSSGANPNDSQSAYNRCFEDDNLYLELLLEYGLTESAQNNWLLEVDGELIEHPQSTLRFQLNHAISSGKFERVKLLVEHGMSLDFDNDGKTPYQTALLSGHKDIAEYLASHGTKVTSLGPVDQLQMALLNADKEQVTELISDDGSLAGQVQETYPNLLEKAVDLDRADAIRLMIDVGFDVNRVTGRTALHQAAWHGNIPMIKLLLALGADPRIRDHMAFAMPIGWAMHNEKPEAVAFLRTQDMDIFGASAFGRTDIVRQLLQEQSDWLNRKFSEHRPNQSQPCANDWMTPLAFAVANSQTEVVELLLECGASIQVSDGAGTSIQTLAREFGNNRIVELVA